METGGRCAPPVMDPETRQPRGCLPCRLVQVLLERMLELVRELVPTGRGDRGANRELVRLGAAAQLQKKGGRGEEASRESRARRRSGIRGQ